FAQRQRFALDATHGMAVDAVLEIVRAAADTSNQSISHSLARMLSKLAAHAEQGGAAAAEDPELRAAAVPRRPPPSMSDPARFLGVFAQALAGMSLYTAGHPARERGIDAAYRELADLQRDTPRPLFTFLGDEVVYGRLPLREMKGWDWSPRLANAGIQRLEFEEQARGTLPLVEAEAVVRSLAVAMHGDRQMLMPLLQLKEFDQYTTTHSMNVAVLSMALAEYLGMSGGDVRAFGVAGLLHDLGKVRVPLEILTKPGKLTPERSEERRVGKEWSQGAVGE